MLRGTHAWIQRGDRGSWTTLENKKFYKNRNWTHSKKLDPRPLLESWKMK